MQEAYCPPCSKYMLCCSSRGDPPILGSDLDRGGTLPCPAPHPGIWPGWGYPIPHPGIWPGWGVGAPPHPHPLVLGSDLDGGGVHPPLSWDLTWIGGTPPCPHPGIWPGWGVPCPLSCDLTWMGGCPAPWVWTDRRLWKHYLPHPSDAGGNQSIYF